MRTFRRCFSHSFLIWGDQLFKIKNDHIFYKMDQNNQRQFNVEKAQDYFNIK